jgi:hypothetical protein
MHEQLLGIPQEEIKELVAAYSTTKQDHHNCTLSPLSHIYLFLIFLHHYPVYLFLATIFKIHPSTAQHIALKMCKFMFHHYSPFLHFHNCTFHLACSWHMLGILVTFALDGAEQPVHTSNNVLADCKLYSAKKGQHSVMKLILVALNRVILWLS